MELTLSSSLAPPSPFRPSHTPRDSPPQPPAPKCVHADRLEHVLDRVAQALGKIDQEGKSNDDVSSEVVEVVKPKARASRLEYRLVDEMYASCSKPLIMLTFCQLAGTLVRPVIRSRSRLSSRKRLRTWMSLSSSSALESVCRVMLLKCQR